MDRTDHYHRKADYGLFFGEAGAVDDPGVILRAVLGREVEVVGCGGGQGVRLRFATDGQLAVLNDVQPIVMPNGMLGYEDADIPYDRYAFEMGFVRDLDEDGELPAVLELGRRFRSSNVSVMIDEGGERVVSLDADVRERLSPLQVSCLTVIDEAWPDAVTPVELATRVGLPTNTAVAHAAALVREGIVSRTSHGRGVSYLGTHSTPAGRMATSPTSPHGRAVARDEVGMSRAGRSAGGTPGDGPTSKGAWDSVA